MQTAETTKEIASSPTFANKNSQNPQKLADKPHVSRLSEPELFSHQLELEIAMTARGQTRFLNAQERLKTVGMEDQSAYGRTLMSRKLTQFAAAIQAWLEEATAGKPGRMNVAAKHLKDVDTSLAAYHALKVIVAGLTEDRPLTRAARDIGRALELECRLLQVRETERGLYENIIRRAKMRPQQHKKESYALRSAKTYAKTDWTPWPHNERIQVGLRLIDICMSSIGIIRITGEKNAGKARSTKHIHPTPEVLDWVNKRIDVLASLRPIYEPMVVPPRDWDGPHGGGYLSSEIAPYPLVKVRNKAYLEELEHADMPIVYAAVNALQRTAWQVNPEVYEVMSTLWAEGSQLGGLPMQEDLKPVPIPEDQKHDPIASKRHRALQSKVYEANRIATSKRIDFSLTLDCAKRYRHYEKIYMPYQLDWRGRIYAVTRLSPQGADYTKGLLRFAKGKPLGEHGPQWLALHGANLAGYDKASLEARVHWILAHEAQILAIANDPYTNRGWCETLGGVEIDKPWQFLAFCFEWRDFRADEEGFESKLAVALDGSCSGLQHYSAMLRDPLAGEAVNLTPGEQPADVYRLVADKVNTMLAEDLALGLPNELKHREADGKAYTHPSVSTLAKRWLEYGVDRKVTKRPVMTLCYGSGEYGFKEQLLSDILRPVILSGREHVFSEDGIHEAAYLAKKISEAVKEVLVAASKGMDWLQEIAKLMSAEDLPVRWTSVVGFPVMQAYMDYTARKLKSSLAGEIIQLDTHTETDRLDKRKQTTAVAPNFIHSCDAAHMMLTVARARQAGIGSFAMVHDSFGCHAADTEEMFYLVRKSFLEIYNERDVLQNFREEMLAQLPESVHGKVPALPEKGDLQLEGVLESRYCFV